ncbi:MAG: PKD domain-containing protein, partial [Litoreibacter sp.]
IVVYSRAELEEALSNTTGGETIYLAQADYGYLRLGHNGHVEFFGHEEKVTIASLDEDNPAMFSRLFLAQVENLRIDGISFKADSAEDDSKEYTRSTVTIRSSDSIELVNSKIDGGNIPGEFYWGVNSVTTYKSNNLLIENNDISGGKLGIAVDTATNVIIRENYVHDILGDNLRVANDLENIYIEGNLLTSVDMDHELFSTHKDHIQFHTYNGTTSSKNIYITDNILIQETGATQGIFIRNEGEEKNGDMRYENVVIENNLIYNGHQHGIRISDVDGLSIQNNTLLYNGDGERAPRVYAHDATDAAIEENVAYKVNLNDVELEGSNIIGDVNDLVIDDDLGRNVSLIERLSDLQVLPGSVLDNSNAGSTLNRFNAAPDQLTALVIKEDLDHLGAPDSFLFDASLSTSTQGFLNAANATFIWDFGDGTTAEGVVVTHTYAQPGDYEVTLTVTHADGQQSTNSTMAEVAEPVLAVFDFDTQDVTDTSSYETTVKYSADDNLAEHYVQTGDGGYAYQLENGNGFEIISPHVQSQNQFSLSFDVQRNEIDSGGGTVFSMSGSFELSITHSGAIVVEVEQKDMEPYKLRTDDGVANDLAWHNITLSYDDVTNKMELFLDGASVGETTIDGLALESTGNHKFELGGKYSLQALIDNIEIT